MVAPLIAAAIALGKQKLDEDNEQWKAMYNFDELQRQNKYAQEAEIRAMRAARAGDSGYAQRAAGMIMHSPQYQHPQSHMQEAGLQAAGSLFAAQENAAEQAKNEARWNSAREALSRQPSSGQGWTPALGEVDRQFGSGLDDEDLLNAWSG